MKEIIIEVPDRFGKTLKPEKVNCEIKGEIVRCRDCRKNMMCKLTIGKPKDWFCADGKGGEVGMKYKPEPLVEGEIPKDATQGRPTYSALEAVVYCVHCKWHRTKACFCKAPDDVEDEWFCSEGERI